MNVCGMGEYALTVQIEPLSEWHWKFWLIISDPLRVVDSFCLHWNDCVPVLGKWSEEGSRWPWVSRFQYCWLVFEHFTVVLGSRDEIPMHRATSSRQRWRHRVLLHLLVLSGAAWQAGTLCWYTCPRSTQGGQYLSAWYTDTTTCLFVRKKAAAAAGTP